MRILPVKLKKNGFFYSQILRGKRSFIYRQQVSKGLYYFEVFRLIKCPHRNFKGVILEAHERFPCNEDFGKTAWSFGKLEDARLKFDVLETNTAKK